MIQDERAVKFDFHTAADLVDGKQRPQRFPVPQDPKHNMPFVPLRFRGERKKKLRPVGIQAPVAHREAAGACVEINQ